MGGGGWGGEKEKKGANMIYDESMSNSHANNQSQGTCKALIMQRETKGR